MRKYHLYLIKENIALHYQGREKMFFQLFSDYKNTDDKELKIILEKQINFITLPITTWEYQRLFVESLQNNKRCRFGNESCYIENGNLSNAKVRITKSSLIIEAEGYYDAESIFFEILRKNEPSFLAIDVEHGRYGWLKPIKERNFV